jgi:hypothetical protein
MTTIPEPSLDETRAFLVAQATRHFGKLPPKLVAEHLLSVTAGSDFPVRRAALEALERRFDNVMAEELTVLESPKGTVLGKYVVGTRRKLKKGGKGSGRRPYETIVEGVRPLRGQCSCPDYLKGSLGLCKHLLTALAHVYEHPRSVERAAAEQTEAPWSETPLLSWDPLIPLHGSADRLRSLHWAGNARTAPFGTVMVGGKVPRELLADPSRRVLFLRKAVAAVSPNGRTAAKIPAGPATVAMLRDELTISEMRVAAEEDGERARAHLRSLRRPLYPYQQEGVDYFLARGRLLLADDMGLGKTSQAIAACHALFKAKIVHRGLIVTPASLKSQWLREWRDVTDVPIVLVDGNAAERTALYQKTKAGFLIVNYELLLKDFEQLAPLAGEMVVLDEAQRIKNYATKSAVYVKALPARFRLVLTGTPMENRLDELASILDWVDDRALAPKWRLPAWYIRYEGDGMKSRVGARNLDTLRERLSDSMLRRSRAEILTQLPKRTDTRVPVVMTEEQRMEHDELSPPIASLAAIAARRPLSQKEFLRLMQLLSTQRMIANGLGQLRFDELWPTMGNRPPSRALLDSLFAPKLDELRTLIESLVLEQNRKVVIFSQWRRMLRLSNWAISDLLARGKKSSRFFTGAESAKLRTQSIVEFHDDPNVAVMFLSDAGGVGLNLQKAASACINLELPWNPAVLEQRIGRIYRLGQKRPIDVFNLVSEASIESRIAGIVNTKQALFKGLFDGTTNELRFSEDSGFIAEVRRLLDEKLPEAPEVATSAGTPAEQAAAEQAALEQADTEVGPDATGPEAMGPYPLGPESLSPDAMGPDSFGADARGPDSLDPDAMGPDTLLEPVPPTQPSLFTASSGDVTELFQKLSVHRDRRGQMTISAPPEVAGTLASVLEGLAKMLRAGG